MILKRSTITVVVEVPTFQTRTALEKYAPKIVAALDDLADEMAPKPMTGKSRARRGEKAKPIDVDMKFKVRSVSVK